MCVAISGKVLDINENTATVEIRGNKIQANIGLVDVKNGDRVLVHASCVIQVLDKTEAEEIDEIWEELKTVLGEDL
ncbi:MAG: HypC/HybG/HupF family hydrogenase formation chaperone [Oscillospiraceae bacterium]|nr:HypC/HybG/HupF family hydrogenase formation chaperone [Oscillospiraceae bacterium]